MNSTDVRIATGRLAGKTVTVSTTAGRTYTGRIGHRAGASFVFEPFGQPALELAYTSVESVTEDRDAMAVDASDEVNRLEAELNLANDALDKIAAALATGRPRWRRILDVYDVLATVGR